MDWRPLSKRDSDEPWGLEAPQEGVPPWLRKSLNAWLFRTLGFMADLPPSVANPEKVLTLELLLQRELSDSTFYALGRAGYEDLALDITDATLNLGDGGAAARQELDKVLATGGSIWRVSTEAPFGLERRVDPTFTSAAEAEMRRGGRPAECLRDAWHAVYQRNPNPKHGYDMAVRAVEAAVSPVLAPRDPKPTLGTMIPAVRDAPHKWEMILSPARVDAVSVVLVPMLQALWDPHKGSRHEPGLGQAPTVITQEEAEAALALAVTLVQWFATGAVRAAVANSKRA